MNRTALTLLALVTVAAIPATAHANANSADADCSGVTFNLPRGETDTIVTTSLDGRVVRTDTIATFGASLAFTIPSPDQTRPHVWAITVDSKWNTDTTWSEQVPACVTPTTTTTPPPSSTTPPTTAPAVAVVTTTTGVAVGPPPTPPVVTTVTTMPGRPTTPTAFTLPATGPDTWLVWLAFVAAFGVGFGSMLVWLNTGRRK